MAEAYRSPGLFGKNFILESNISQMSISIDGFFEYKQKKAFTYAQKLIKTLKDTKSFENVDIVEEKEISFKNTNMGPGTVALVENERIWLGSFRSNRLGYITQ